MNIGSDNIWLHRVSVICGAAPILLGSVVLAGWYMRSVILIQVHANFVPMQHNTALGFLLSGSALLGVIYGKKRLAQLLGTITAGLGFLTLVEYWLAINLGIDELFMEHYITVATSHAGRMAPNTALCFLLVGLAAMIPAGPDGESERDVALGFLGSIVAGLGTISLFGYLSGITTAYGWGQMTQMAVHTSAGFLVAGMGLSFAAAAAGREPGHGWLLRIPLFVFVGLLTLSISMWQALGAIPRLTASALPVLALVVSITISILFALSVWLFQNARNKTEKAILANEKLRRLEQVFEHAMLGIVVANVHTNELVSVNDAFAVMHGYTQVEMEALNLIDVLSEEDKRLLPERAKQAHRLGRLEYEAMHIRKDGSLFPVLTHVATLFDANGEPQYRTASYYDITERKQAEELRITLEKRFRQHQKLESIGTLAGGVAHEINNPLTAIMNFAQLIGDRLKSGSSLREYSDGIIEQTDRVAGIVKGLLSFASADRESRSPAQILDIVNSTVSLVGPTLLRDEIDLRVDVPDELPRINCRSQQLQQVLMNLITNAREALNARYPGKNPDKVIHLKVQLHKEIARNWLRITVEDHGAGIPEEIRDHVFDPFFTTKGRAERTGLGLSISHGIVQDHGGSLNVECAADRPTRFWFDLPVYETAAEGENRFRKE